LTADVSLRGGAATGTVALQSGCARFP